jgi:hypothetical protein
VRFATRLPPDWQRRPNCIARCIRIQRVTRQPPSSEILLISVMTVRTNCDSPRTSLQFVVLRMRLKLWLWFLPLAQRQSNPSEGRLQIYVFANRLREPVEFPFCAPA